VSAEVAKQFGGAVATDETVLTGDFDDVEDWEFTKTFEEGVETDPSTTTVDVTGDPTPSELERLTSTVDIE
jgi:hypothetical protein